MAYKLTHPKRPKADPIEVRADMVAMYESQGWETAPTANPPEAEKPAKK